MIYGKHGAIFEVAVHFCVEMQYRAANNRALGSCLGLELDLRLGLELDLRLGLELAVGWGWSWTFA